MSCDLSSRAHQAHKPEWLTSYFLYSITALVALITAYTKHASIALHTHVRATCAARVAEDAQDIPSSPYTRTIGSCVSAHKKRPCLYRKLLPTHLLSLLGSTSVTETGTVTVPVLTAAATADKRELHTGKRKKDGGIGLGSILRLRTSFSDKLRVVRRGYLCARC